MRAADHAQRVVELVCPIGQVVAGPDGRVLWWNAAAGEQLDGIIDFDIGITNLIHPDDAATEQVVALRDAGGRWCYASLRPATGPDGRSYQVLFLLYVA